MNSQSRERRKRTSRNSTRYQVERLEGRALLSSMTEFGLTAGSGPVSIVKGPDGALWFTETGTNKIGRITTAGAITEFSIPTSGSNPLSITSGPDGNLWFTENATNKIGRITTAGAITEFALTTGSHPQEITKGSDGNLWFTENGTDKVASILPTGANAGTIAEYSLAVGSGPYGITSGPNGNLWFTENGASKVGQIVPSGIFAGTVNTYPLSSGAGPRGITTGSDGNLWFIEEGGTNIGQVTLGGSVTEFATPNGDHPNDIVSGPNGDLYYTPFYTDDIGVISTGGAFSSYAIPTPTSRTIGITVGPDNHIWFAEANSSRIGRLNLNPTAVDDTYNATESTAANPVTLTVNAIAGVLHNDTDPEADTLSSAGVVTQPAHGVVTLNEDGSFSYTPNNNYQGADSFTYQATDGANASNTATVRLTVAAPASTLTVSDASGTYGGTTTLQAHLTSGGGDLAGELVDFHIGATDLGTVMTTAGGIATLSNASLAAIHAGSYSGDVTASFAGDSNHGASNGSANLKVSPALLTITADNQTKVYGAALPTLTASYAGFVNRDTSASLETPVSLTTGALGNSSVGSYPIHPGGATSGDYTISFVNGSLGVTPAPLTIVIDSLSKVYGQVNPTLTGTVTGVLFGDDVAASYATTATRYTDVLAGGSPITLAGLTGETAANYSTTVTGGSVTPGVLTVTPAPLTVVVADQSKVYGQVNPAATGVFLGVLNGDNVGVVYGTTATQYSDVQAVGYPITPTGLTGTKAADYSLSVEGSSVTDGTLTVGRAPLAIAVSNLTRPYGQANPALTGSVGGVLNNDDVSVQYTTSATGSSDVVSGGYPITITGLSGLKAGDYSIGDSQPGTLTVAPAPLTISAVDASKVYGQANPAFTASDSGFVLGQGPGVLSGMLGFSTTAGTSSHVGQYLVTPNGLTSVNYAIQFLGGNLSITPATLTATANNQVQPSGGPVPPLTVSYAGFVNGDTPASLTTPVTASTAVTAASAPGTYPILAGGGSSADYTIVDVPGTLTVSPASTTISPRKGVPDDYTGSGLSDIAVYLPSIGAFDIRTPDGAEHLIRFGIPGAGQSIPAPGDYDGSGHTELAVYIPSQGVFAYRPAKGGPDVEVSFGIPGAGMTIPAPGDYDGSGHTELAVYLPSQGLFIYRPAKGGPDVATSFGIAGAGQTIPMPGDYDGSGHTELAVYLPSQGRFAFRPASGADVNVPFGIAGAGQTIPMPGDYDGSGHTELAAYLPSIATFAYRPARGGPDVYQYFGVTGSDQVLPSAGDYTGVGHDQLAAYLPGYGTFAIRPGGGLPDVVTSLGIPGAGQTIPVTVVVDQALAEMASTVSAASITIPDSSTIADSLVSSKARRKSGSL